MTKHLGASMGELFKIRDEIQQELERRAWIYLVRIGYSWFRQTTMHVSLYPSGSRRKDLPVLHIVAEFEFDHASQHVDIDVPLAHFSGVVNSDVKEESL